MIRFLPGYVGSKTYWVPHLEHLRGLPVTELFSGSAVLSANLASEAHLNDLDPVIYRIFTHYGELECPDVFTAEDYFNVRGRTDWWRWAYCLMKMSFSGVFRYSKNGFNVPIKKNIKNVQVREEFEAAQKRFKELSPRVTCLSYEGIKLKDLEGRVAVFDPPYEGSQAAYNTAFDYDRYWDFVDLARDVAHTVLVFDRLSNMPFPNPKKRAMRVNGKHAGDTEAMVELRPHGSKICSVYRGRTFV